MASFDVISAILWFISSKFDDEPFETESETIGIVLGIMALVAAALSAWTYLGKGEQPLVVAFAIASALYGAIVLFFYAHMAMKQKFKKDNWGYFLLLPICLISIVSHLFAAWIRKQNTGNDNARRYQETELSGLAQPQAYSYPQPVYPPMNSQQVFQQQAFQQQAPVGPHITNIDVHMYSTNVGGYDQQNMGSSGWSQSGYEQQNLGPQLAFGAAHPQRGF